MVVSHWVSGLFVMYQILSNLNIFSTNTAAQLNTSIDWMPSMGHSCLWDRSLAVSLVTQNYVRHLVHIILRAKRLLISGLTPKQLLCSQPGEIYELRHRTDWRCGSEMRDFPCHLLGLTGSAYVFLCRRCFINVNLILREWICFLSSVFVTVKNF